MAFFVHRFANRALRVTLALFSDFKIEGQENIPADGPLIVVANHQSNVDPAILATSIRRNARFLSKDTIFNNVTPAGRWFLRAYGAYPLRRGEMDLKALRWALTELKRPTATLVLFPEGTRNPGSMKSAHSGIVPLAARAGIPILPVGMEGVEGMRSVLRIFKPKGSIRVRIGRPFHLNVQGKLSRNDTEAAVSEIMGRIAVLLPESYRGDYKEAAEATFVFTSTNEPSDD
jgi:1-acyl-sn-glycerol-3-phosphate acyltransferase